MNILLVEPGYKNKYPPLGLMKISTYHKRRGDEVRFVKGISNDVYSRIWDRIYITTLFTFDFDITVKTIRYYKKAAKTTHDIYVGGILATLMTEKLRNEVGLDNIVRGQLFSSAMLGFDDNVNIDELPLDYDILDEVEYRYPAGDNYFGYTTRGCPNQCSFCAVPTLEPKFETTNHIYDQIMEINHLYGEKKDLLLLDNNILYAPDLEKIVEDIRRAGFIKEPSFIAPTPYERALKKLEKRVLYPREIRELITWLKGFPKRVRKQVDHDIFMEILTELVLSEDVNSTLLYTRDRLEPLIEKYRSKAKSSRYVDFNQGTDARLLNEEKMEILSRIPVRPLRIAFDNIRSRHFYERAVRLAHQYGVREISNYMLYNFDDKPEDLWTRLKINLDIKEELGLNIFSFPMKYIPVTHTNREHIGEHWNKKYIRAIQAILLVKKGIVSTHKSFFEKAFGSNLEEYFEILMMPEDFIIYRNNFEDLGLTQKWQTLYRAMTEEERKILLELVKQNKVTQGPLFADITSRIAEILPYYNIQYKARKSI